MADIISIASAVPENCHLQNDILKFMQESYQLDETDKRKLAFLYNKSGINTRYSAISDFSIQKKDRTFIPVQSDAPFPSLEKRMAVYEAAALPLSIEAINRCIKGHIEPKAITHLITISCTGMSAPGLDLAIMEQLQLASNTNRTSVNFMGCYAAIHGLKIAKGICDNTPGANVVMVATELCTLHFQKEFTHENAASSLLFADGAAAVLINNHTASGQKCSLQNFYSEVVFKGKNEMSWQLSSNGFLMSLSGYIPQLIEEDIAQLTENALKQSGLTKKDITHWCIHPGGRKIIDVIQSKLELSDDAVSFSRNILAQYGNMSSPTILFVLNEILKEVQNTPATIFGIAFGPGLTMETFIVSTK